MKLLMVGAGAIGGYFGGRLVEKGEDVTFLVRERRRKQLEETGLHIRSIHGDFQTTPTLIQAGEIAGPFDAVLLSMKAYQLDQAIEDIRPYVGENTMIIPLLNGIAHMDRLIAAFGEENVLGGLCFVEATLNEQGHIIQSSGTHDFIFGERSGERSERVSRLEDTFSNTKSNFVLSETILADMWKKYLFISTLSGVTSLYRSPIGPIRDDEYGSKTVKKTLTEAAAIMKSLDAPLPDGVEEANWDKLHDIEHTMKSSLQRDMEKGLSVEGDHFFGYLLEKADEQGIPAPTLETIYANLRVYEN
ncbi:ketopantoate reductase family protein [Bacillus sp. H-16]|uniref:ketopantoate reductase family protein n=1 Tax=Alteribacter salitolerans TaxID=2912333 RepID=UPI001964F1A4|nr:ketopantoate reductase family protein [Alteribacter salitolerans]MBM7094869.1 ketopantoate reductase family protein [Alteribacter salitolerans]